MIFASNRGEPGMSGADRFTEDLFSMRHIDNFVPADHSLRVIRVKVNKATWVAIISCTLVSNPEGLGVRSPLVVYRELLMNSPQHSALSH